MKDGREKLASERVGRLLFRFSVPAIAGMFSQAMYNVADAFFVGRDGGPDAIAALAIAFPVQLFVMSVGIWMGVGGGSIISRRFGEDRVKEAERAFGTVLSAGFLIGIFLIILVYIFREPLLRALGASENILGLAMEYILFVMPAALFIIFKMITNNVIRAEGNARDAMAVMISGAFLNIILDPVFIFVLGMGVKGAALATVTAQGISALYAIYYFSSKRSIIKFRAGNFIIRRVILVEAFIVGSSAFLQHVMMAVISMVMNKSAQYYGGDIAVAFFGIFMRLFSLLAMPVQGIVQGMLPIAGFAYGAKNYDRVISVVKKAMGSGTLLAAAGISFIVIFPAEIFSLFSSDPALLKLADSAVPICMAGVIFIPYQMTGSAAFQSLGKGGRALLLTSLRQIVFFIPAAIVLPVFMGLNGLWFAFPFGDTASAVLTSFFVSKEYRLLRRSERDSAEVCI